MAPQSYWEVPSSGPVHHAGQAEALGGNVHFMSLVNQEVAVFSPQASSII